jgi:ATP phosphoribosyltransferase
VKALVTALQSVINARGMMYLMMNVPEDAFERVKQVVPGLKGPTVMKVESEEAMLAVHVVVSEDRLFEVVEELKRVGARDILIMPIQRLIY